METFQIAINIHGSGIVIYIFEKVYLSANETS